ncbi:uncharacterized protein LOC124437615 [Xenia sp. Carnegie-2017]|uniref:uncharacterized protein LOC124437615 n=1 Tax=Xenia sp. Carnegie-2017 TaxID=2897299 RepID=UPI001F04E794|nr:uncharacterized protein LOC124437615 [Xenia sp. Carnegie-2017]
MYRSFYEHFEQHSRHVEFFVFCVACTWIFTIVSFLFFTVGGHKILHQVNWVLAMAIIYVIFTVMLLISAGILADNTKSYKASGLCDSWKSVHKDIECNNLVVAVVFAFTAFILYIVDSSFHFWLSVVATDSGNELETAEMEL